MNLQEIDTMRLELVSYLKATVVLPFPTKKLRVCSNEEDFLGNEK